MIQRYDAASLSRDRMCNHADRPQMQVIVSVRDPKDDEIAVERWALCPQCLAIWSERFTEILDQMDREGQAEAHWTRVRRGRER